MLRIIVAGLGPIGLATARAIRAESGMQLVGLVDPNPERCGVTLADFAGEPGIAQDQGAEPRVTTDIAEAIGDGADVAVVATTPYLEKALPLIESLIQRGLSVISSCEELAWPWYRYPDLARKLDADARAAGRAILATGINPGFVMDKLPIVLATVVRRVTGVRCVRRVNAAVRRKSLQSRIGATLTPDAFRESAARGDIGHHGLCESTAMLAAGLGRVIPFGAIVTTTEPVIATEPTPSALGLIEPGKVAGLRSTATWSGEGLELELDLTMAVGVSDSYDKITIEGPVQLHCKIPGAIPGDSATVAALMNYIPRMPNMTPGLRTMLDVPAAGCHNLDIVRNTEPVVGSPQ